MWWLSDEKLREKLKKKRRGKSMVGGGGQRHAARLSTGSHTVHTRFSSDSFQPARFRLHQFYFYFILHFFCILNESIEMLVPSVGRMQCSDVTPLIGVAAAAKPVILHWLCQNAYSGRCRNRYQMAGISVDDPGLFMPIAHFPQKATHQHSKQGRRHPMPLGKQQAQGPHLTPTQQSAGKTHQPKPCLAMPRPRVQ